MAWSRQTNRYITTYFFVFYVKVKNRMVLIFLIFSHGFNKWRDPIKPTAILQRLCKDYKLDGPHFSDGKCRIEGKMFHARDHIVDDNGKRDF